MFPKALAVFFFVFCLIMAPAWAQLSEAGMLETEADLALARLSTLDSALDTRPDAFGEDLTRLKQDFHLTDINSTPLRLEHLMGVPGSERPYGISPFVWGLVLNVPGVLVVYLLTGERRPAHQAIFGAITGGILIALLYFIVISPN